MTIEQLKSLTEDEQAMLWGCVNVIEPKLMKTYDVDVHLCTSIKHIKLMNRLLNCKLKIKEDYHAIYDSLIAKLKNC
jgi:hypothetical protein